MTELVLRFVVAMQTGYTGRTHNEDDRERGATAVEYGLLVALIAIVIIGAVTLLGGNLTGLFHNTATQVHS